MAFEWPAGYVWRSELGGWVTPEQALADARKRFRRIVSAGGVRIGTDPDPAYQPEQVGTRFLPG
jgi:hypothetical protein